MLGPQGHAICHIKVTFIAESFTPCNFDNAQFSAVRLGPFSYDVRKPFWHNSWLVCQQHTQAHHVICAFVPILYSDTITSLTAVAAAATAAEAAVAIASPLPYHPLPPAARGDDLLTCRVSACGSQRLVMSSTAGCSQQSCNAPFLHPWKGRSRILGGVAKGEHGYVQGRGDQRTHRQTPRTECNARYRHKGRVHRSLRLHQPLSQVEGQARCSWTLKFVTKLFIEGDLVGEQNRYERGIVRRRY